MEIGNDVDPEFPEHWPREQDLPGFRATMNSFHLACHHLHLRIMSLLAVALDLDPDYFEPSISSRSHCLRLLHYPPTERTEGNTRIGSHTDFGTVSRSIENTFPESLADKRRIAGNASLARFDWGTRSDGSRR